MKLILRRCVAIALVVVAALAATLLVATTADAQAESPPKQACIIHVFHTPVDCDREQAVADMVTALESYAEQHGTYLVEGTGFLGRGSGWAFWEQEGSAYPTSIASVLAGQDHLTADTNRGPQWSAMSDMLVYRCRDRVAVFITDSAQQPSVSDQNWWASNRCFMYPIDTLGATYFEVSEPLLAD